MIDCENEIYTALAAELREKFPDITVYGRTEQTPSSFPCVCIEETDNFAHTRTRDSGSSCCHAEVMYEVNVYSNKASGQKAECREIFAAVNDMLEALGFTRLSRTPVALDDATKYRVCGRFTALISKNKTIYRR